MSILNRRSFLKTSGAAVAGVGFAGALGGNIAHASSAGGYRALVGIFLLGGADCFDMLMPYDQASYNRYKELRKPLLDSYARWPVGMRRERSDLLALSPRNGSSFGARAFALPPQMPRMHNLFERGKSSIVANTGPLVTQINRAQFDQQQSLRPKRLFSHNDQQSIWMSLSPEGATNGWGGRFSDCFKSANGNPEFTSVSLGGASMFGTGDDVMPYHASVYGVEDVWTLQRDRTTYLGTARDSAIAHAALEDHIRGVGVDHSSLFAQDMSDATVRSIESNTLFNTAQNTASSFSGSFPNTYMGRALARVAQTIATRDQLNVSRQVFQVNMQGFDTHSAQARDLVNAQIELDEAVGAFYDAIESMGMENDVTLFTASDFGRTLTTNGDGTDHGWGGHSFVVGGAVDGGKIFGDVPAYDLGHELDAGKGRLIPTTSVEQFAAPLGRWFGLNENELSAALPTLSRFGAAPAYI